MQTFSDFINRRFGYNENTDQNQQVVPEETIKKSMELEKIIHLILDNPNYFKKFFETVKEFVYDLRDNDLQAMMQNLQDNFEQYSKNKGLAQETGVLDKPNNLPPNMGG